MIITEYTNHQKTQIERINLVYKVYLTFTVVQPVQNILKSKNQVAHFIVVKI